MLRAITPNPLELARPPPHAPQEGHHQPRHRPTSPPQTKPELEHDRMDHHRNRHACSTLFCTRVVERLIASFSPTLTMSNACRNAALHAPLRKLGTLCQHGPDFPHLQVHGIRRFQSRTRGLGSRAERIGVGPSSSQQLQGTRPEPRSSAVPNILFLSFSSGEPKFKPYKPLNPSTSLNPKP